MAKRPRLTVEDVLDHWSDDSDDDYLDDPDEPLLEGSDDEFSDLEKVKEDDTTTDNTHLNGSTSETQDITSTSTDLLETETTQ